MEKTVRFNRLMADMDESNFATLIVLQNQRVANSILVDRLITTIGREADCAIPLVNDTEVSRQHAQVRIGLTPDGMRQYLLSDLGSTNGTFLNGKRLEPSHEVLLTDGDKIGIGQHVIKFAVLDQSGEKFMTGNLNKISLFDLIQVIENNRLTCTLVIRSQLLVARLYFNDGRIVDCDVDIKQGEGKVIDLGVESLRAMDAFRRLAAVEEGLFEVEKSDTPFPQTIENVSNTNLVLDTLREIDEERERARQVS